MSLVVLEEWLRAVGIELREQLGIEIPREGALVRIDRQRRRMVRDRLGDTGAAAQPEERAGSTVGSVISQPDVALLDRVPGWMIGDVVQRAGVVRQHEIRIVDAVARSQAALGVEHEEVAGCGARALVAEITRLEREQIVDAADEASQHKT